MDRDVSQDSFLGIGWAFPVGLDAAGEVALAVHEQDIRQAIWIILGTARGERVMRPDFGAGLRDFVFEPVNTTTMALVQNRVEGALITWEPRIDLLGVDVTADSPVRNKLLIHIRYRVRQTNTSYNLVYPFYLAEGESP